MKEESGEKKTPPESEKKSEHSPVVQEQKGLRFEEALNRAIGKLKQERLEFARVMYQEEANKKPEDLKRSEVAIENVQIKNLAIIYTLNDDGPPYWYAAPIKFGQQEVGSKKADMVHMLRDTLHLIELQDMVDLFFQVITKAFVGKPEGSNKTNLASVLINKTAEAVVHGLQELSALRQKMGQFPGVGH